MLLVFKIATILLITGLALGAGGWIAHRLITMDNRSNLIDW